MEDNTRNSTDEGSSNFRKIRKPIVEKHRRDRINNSISHLKTLIAENIEEKISPMTRIDKADILEFTVDHLAKLQQQQQRSVATAKYVTSYNAGFKDCAREAVSYLSTNKQIPEATIRFLNTHLHNIYLIQNRENRTPPRDLQRFSTPARPVEFGHILLTDSGVVECSPIQCGSKNSPDVFTLYDSGISCNNSLSRGSHNYSIFRTSDNNSLSMASNGNSVFRASNNNSLSRTGNDNSVFRTCNNNSLFRASSNNSLSRASSDNSIVKTSENDSLSGITSNSSISSANRCSSDCRVSMDFYHCSMDRSLENVNANVNIRVNAPHIVSIEKGQQNEIGHMINDNIWRPW